MNYQDALAKQAKAKEKKAKRKAKRRIIFSGRPKPVSRSVLVKRLDAIFSLYIRLRDKKVSGGLCVLCLKRPIEVCFHWISRGSFATRWDERNAVGSCKGCNFEETFRKQKYRDMFISRYGLPLREELESMARGLTHIPNFEIQEKIRFFTEAMK